jgi:hypothetical protein
VIGRSGLRSRDLQRLESRSGSIYQEVVPELKEPNPPSPSNVNPDKRYISELEEDEKDECAELRRRYKTPAKLLRQKDVGIRFVQKHYTRNGIAGKSPVHL